MSKNKGKNQRRALAHKRETGKRAGQLDAFYVLAIGLSTDGLVSLDNAIDAVVAGYEEGQACPV